MSLKLHPPEDMDENDEKVMEKEGKYLEKWPENASSTNDIARTLSGLKPPTELNSVTYIALPYCLKIFHK